jgi:hypothetical protein
MPNKAYSEIGDRLVEFAPDGAGRDECSRWSQQSFREEAGAEIPEWVSSFQAPGSCGPDLTGFLQNSIVAPLAMSHRKIGPPRSSIFDVA